MDLPGSTPPRIGFIGIKKSCLTLLEKVQPVLTFAHLNGMNRIVNPIMNPIRCHLLGEMSLRPGALESFISRTPQLQLVDSSPNAELLFVETQSPVIGGVLLGRCPENGRLVAHDFLTKPYDYGAFLRAIQKARGQLRNLPAPEYPPPVVNTVSVPAPATAAAYFFVKSDYKIVRIDTDRVLYVEGMKNYAKIYLQGENKPIISLISLKALLQHLPASSFVRVHRSYIVHLRYLQAVERGVAHVGTARIPIADKHKAEISALVK